MKPIVIGVDGTDASAAAVRWAAHRAAETGAELLVVHAWKPGRGRAAEHDLRGTRSLVRQNTMEWVLGALDQDDPHLPIRVEVRIGRPATVLLAAARGASMLVLGHDDLAGTPHARQLVRTCLTDAPCPVVVVRRSDQEAISDTSLLGMAR